MNSKVFIVKFFFILFDFLLVLLDELGEFLLESGPFNSVDFLESS